MALPRPRSLAGQLFAMQVLLVALVVAGCAVFTYLNTRDQAEEAARTEVTVVARTIADAPSVLSALDSDDPSAALQPYAEQVRRDTGITFVTIMRPDGERLTHPNPELIGESFLGHTEPALRGETFTESYTGTLGPSTRVVTPVWSDDEIVALVSAGLAVETIGRRVADQVSGLLMVAGGALALGGVGTWAVNARLRRHTHGMNAAELSRIYDYHQATLRALREGLLLLDGTGRIALANDAALELLGLPDEPVGRTPEELDLSGELVATLRAEGPLVDEVRVTEDRVLLVNAAPVSGGSRRGTVVTLRDHTELQELAGELDSALAFTDALRAQAHEAANRLHAVVALIELGRADEAVEFATAELELAQALTDRVVDAVAEPVLAALLLGKVSQANERGVELLLTDDSRIDDGVLPRALPPRDLVTILGNLIDNAMEAAMESARERAAAESARESTPRAGARVWVRARADAHELLLEVSDSGGGLRAESAEAAFDWGWSTKPAGDRSRGPRGVGLALVRQAVRRNRGTVEVSRAATGGARFTVRLPLRVGVA
ncbi:Sensor histidine kinase regulating citrate/malate metabolism [Streptomyces zhaozhouensis]|uniref:histidine kinase n=1 Tax=Streptomyces zhaozhouensis TaxID=1300267 RepID=A0A286DL68_9ACTN|nr:sensor histidine kinase [Streptomyces zhaozhouensis]SOD59379.1 Sensor histidine kinase regulating citrate/malate metabolism [Streptomyces zhaozhouensis]